MITELAAANAAFEVIKNALANGKDIYDAGAAAARYFGLKAEIQKKAHQHGHKSDIEAFMAAEQLAAQEDELKQMMIYQGRPGMWGDWLRFQADMKRSRDEEERKRISDIRKRRAMLLNVLLWTSLVVSVIVLFSSAIFITIAANY
jgi:hypothetical protein